MISTRQIQAALLKTIEGSALVGKVITSADSDLAANLESLRDNSTTLVVIVPGADEFRNEFVEGTNIPLLTEIRSNFDLLISGRNLNMTEAGDAATLSSKDALLDLLIWHDLAIPSLVVIPLTCEPLVVDFDEAGRREAWRFSLSVRQILEE